jgi:hypothetical protein
MHIFAELEIHEKIFVSYMRTKDMEDSKGSYNNEYDIRGLHVNMGNVEFESNGHRRKLEAVELVETMRSLQKEVHIYRVDNDRMIISQEDLL